MHVDRLSRILQLLQIKQLRAVLYLNSGEAACNSLYSFNRLFLQTVGAEMTLDTLQEAVGSMAKYIKTDSDTTRERVQHGGMRANGEHQILLV